MLIGTKTANARDVRHVQCNDFAIAPLHDRVGVIHGSMERLDRTYFFNELGLYDTRSAFQYGNFSQSALSNRVKTYLEAHLNDLIDTCVNHEKNQYRAFFADGTALYVTIVNGQTPGVYDSAISP